MKLFAEGTDLSQLEKLEPTLSIGDEVRLYPKDALSLEHLQELRTLLPGMQVEQVSRVLSIRYGSPSGIGFVPLLIPALIAIPALFLGWQVFKKVSAIPSWVWLLGAGALIYMLVKSE